MPYRILSLDGGGCWSLIQAMALDKLFPGQTGHQILNRFNLAIANSGGSIVLAGLIKDLTPKQICALFQTAANRNSIFVRRDWIRYEADKLMGLGPRYVAASKFAGLSALLKAGPNPVDSLRMNEMSTYVGGDNQTAPQIIIVAFDYDWRREVFFRSRASYLDVQGAIFTPTLAGAVHASTNAPIDYFDAPAVVDIGNNLTRRFWDGAIGGYNNPLLHGVMEALANGAARSDIVALSLGSGTVWRPQGPALNGESAQLFQAVTNPSLIADIKAIADAIIDDPPDTASLQSHVITGAHNDAPQVIRLSPHIRPVKNGTGWVLPDGFSKMTQPNSAVAMDPLNAFDYLCNLDMDATGDNDIDMIRQLAEQWISGTIPNQPILKDPVSGMQIIGYPSFDAAQQAISARLTPTVAPQQRQAAE